MNEKNGLCISKSLRIIEKSLRNKYSKGMNIDKTPCVFILGSPRTGSTLFYQFLINHFQFYYPTNLFNDIYFKAPVTGVLFEQESHERNCVEYISNYGKTKKIFDPSEASNFFNIWFGGTHPSEIYSKNVIPEMEKVMLKTFAAIHRITKYPLLFKNAWNCFRIKSLAHLFPMSYFIWIRRDIAQAARSDLEARAKHGSYEKWNSASPGNYLEIQKKPYWEQVVEQQYEYGKRIASDFSNYCSTRSIQIWYEDLCMEPKKVLADLDKFFQIRNINVKRSEPEIEFSTIPRTHLLESDEEGSLIMSYLQSIKDDRLASFYHSVETGQRN